MGVLIKATMQVKSSGIIIVIQTMVIVTGRNPCRRLLGHLQYVAVLLRPRLFGRQSMHVFRVMSAKIGSAQRNVRHAELPPHKWMPMGVSASTSQGRSPFHWRRYPQSSQLFMLLDGNRFKAIMKFSRTIQAVKAGRRK